MLHFDSSDDIHKEYQNNKSHMKGFSMQIDDGDFVFLVGPSGSGKSTIIKLITGGDLAHPGET